MIGARGEIRTHNLQNLSLTPLPVGLHRHNLVDLLGTAPSLSACKAEVLTSITIGPGFGTPGVNRTLPTSLEDQCRKNHPQG